MKTGSREWWLDRAALISVALVCASLAWLFFAGTGQWSTLILQAIVLVTLVADNRRLRKELKRYRNQ